MMKFQNHLLHCDDKRTIAALKAYILEATEEMQELKTKTALGEEPTGAKERIMYLEKAISDAKDQLQSM